MENEVVFVAGIHGNERLPVKALQDAGVKFVLGNPVAYEKNVRFLDQDLNASFGTENETCESKRAADLLMVIPEEKLVIDFHTTTAETEPFVIIVDKAQVDFAKSLGIKKIVLMSLNIKSGKSLINYRNGVSVELGHHEDLENSYNLPMSISTNLGKIFECDEYELYEVYDVIKEEGNFQNFKECNESFVPILYGEHSYRDEGIFGLKAKSVLSFI